MKVSGFTFIRNGNLLGYPFIESIKSLLAVCDEVIVAVGNSEDDTLKCIEKINNSNLKILQTNWNENMIDRGFVYAQQKMIAQFNCSGDWCFYLECDEIIHEQDYVNIKNKMSQYLNNPQVEALVFDYHHLYGCKDYVIKSPKWYSRAPRILKNNIRSWAPDGLFWVIMDKNKKGRYPKAKLINSYIYHYGHVRSVSSMNEKNKRVEKYWNNSEGGFSTYGNIDPYIVKKFTDVHPLIIQEWLRLKSEQQFIINPNYKLSSRDIRHRLEMYLSKFLFNIDWSRKHFKLLK